MSAGGSTGDAGAPAPVPQRLVLVLPSSGRYDSRTYRIASAATARGHEVTILARSEPGIPDEERTPEGYRIVRSHVSSIDGLPLPAPLRRALAARRYGPAARRSSGDPEAETPARTAPDRAPRSSQPVARVRSLARAAIRIAALALTARSQRRAALRLDPGGDLYHAMAYMGIGIGLTLGRRAGRPVVYDARDIYVDAGNLARLPGPARRLLAAVERGWARRADRVVTVNRPYAEVMAARWAVEMPAIVMNCSYRFDPPEPRDRRFHERLGLDPSRRVVLYQGGFSPDRGIEQLIDAIRSVPDGVLVLMGYGVLRPRLEALAADPATGGRIRLMPAVPPAELLGWVAAADVVAVPIQPTTLNHRLTTPNKLLEALAAGVPVVASDLPGMADIVRDSGAGILVRDPTDPAELAAAIRRILDAPPDERRAYAARALAAAHDTYSWEAQVARLLHEYGRLTGRPW